MNSLVLGSIADRSLADGFRQTSTARCDQRPIPEPLEKVDVHGAGTWPHHTVGCSVWSSILRHPEVTVGASGTLTSITSPLCRDAPARMEETSSYFAVSWVAVPMSTTTGVVRANCTQPAGSSVTPVTWPTNEGGSV